MKHRHKEIHKGRGEATSCSAKSTMPAFHYKDLRGGNARGHLPCYTSEPLDPIDITAKPFFRVGLRSPSAGGLY